jgi:hypothetical protein
MAFISNKERQKTSARLYRGAGFRKFFILISLICCVLCALLVLLGLLVDLGKVKDAGAISLIEHNDSGNISLTTYGIICAVITCVALVGGVISVILLFTMRSPRSVTRDVYRLTSSAIPGKRTSKHTASETRDRL